MTQNRFSSPLLGDRSALVRFKPKLACHSWTELENLTSNCQACQLHQSRTRVVRGRYSQQKQAELLIIGEGPGKVEDIEGLAFVGDSGKLLDIMLDSWRGDNPAKQYSVYVSSPSNPFDKMAVY